MKIYFLDRVQIKSIDIQKVPVVRLPRVRSARTKDDGKLLLDSYTEEALCILIQQ